MVRYHVKLPKQNVVSPANNEKAGPKDRFGKGGPPKVTGVANPKTVPVPGSPVAKNPFVTPAHTAAGPGVRPPPVGYGTSAPIETKPAPAPPVKTIKPGPPHRINPPPPVRSNPTPGPMPVRPSGMHDTAQPQIGLAPPPPAPIHTNPNTRPPPVGNPSRPPPVVSRPPPVGNPSRPPPVVSRPPPVGNPSRPPPVVSRPPPPAPKELTPVGPPPPVSNPRGPPMHNPQYQADDAQAPDTRPPPPRVGGPPVRAPPPGTGPKRGPPPPAHTTGGQGHQDDGRSRHQQELSPGIFFPIKPSEHSQSIRSNPPTGPPVQAKPGPPPARKGPGGPPPPPSKVPTGHPPSKVPSGPPPPVSSKPPVRGPPPVSSGGRGPTSGPTGAGSRNPGAPPPARDAGQQQKQRTPIDLNKILEGLGTCHQIIGSEEVVSLKIKND
jgi:hypothetical protein